MKIFGRKLKRKIPHHIAKKILTSDILNKSGWSKVAIFFKKIVHESEELLRVTELSESANRERKSQELSSVVDIQAYFASECGNRWIIWQSGV